MASPLAGPRHNFERGRDSPILRLTHVCFKMVKNNEIVNNFLCVQWQTTNYERVLYMWDVSNGKVIFLGRLPCGRRFVDSRYRRGAAPVPGFVTGKGIMYGKRRTRLEHRAATLAAAAAVAASMSASVCVCRLCCCRRSRHMSGNSFGSCPSFIEDRYTPPPLCYPRHSSELYSDFTDLQDTHGRREIPRGQQQT